jgi:uncharacterized membrane protein (DUF441 family)
MERLKSRKFWLTVLAGAIVAFGQQFGIELDAEQIISLSGLIAAYVGGQALVDKNKVQAEVQSKVANLSQYIATLHDMLQEIQQEDVPDAGYK